MLSARIIVVGENQEGLKSHKKASRPMIEAARFLAYFLRLLTASFNFLPTANLTVLLAGTLIKALV
jgi:hypothetical protein